LIDCPYPEIFFGGARGGGKGLPKEHRVLTPFGWREIGRLKEGDKICATDGTVTSVIGVYHRGVQPMYRLTLHDGTVVRCDEDHIWLGWEANKSRKIGNERTSGESAARKWTTRQIFGHYQRHGIKHRIALPVISAPCAMNGNARWGEIPPYVIGVLLGNCGSLDKRVPSGLLFAPADQRWEVLRGLMDTDGWAEADGDCYFASISRGLAEDVRNLARSLGAVVTMRVGQKACTNAIGRPSTEAFCLRIKMPEPERMFALPRKQAVCRGRVPQSMGVWIDSIEPCKPEETVCIQVAHPSSLFIIEDFVVTHNSDGVLGKWGVKAALYGERFNAVLFRPEMPGSDDLWARAEEIYGLVGASLKESKKTIIMPGGGRIRFRPLESVSDAGKYQGQNLSDVAIEEAGLYPSPKPIDMMHGAMRSASGVPTQMILTGNPGGPGQQWIAERYINPAPLGMKKLIRVLPNGKEHKYIFIPSKVRDNKILLDNDPSYIDRLYLVGSPQLVKAWLDGDWSAIEGAFFQEFSVARHVLRPVPIPAFWMRFRAMDWGSAKPFCVQWYAVAGDDWQHPDGHVIPRGAMVCYREWYGASAPNVGLKLTADAVGKGIKEREKDERIDEAASVIDPATFTQDGGPSIAERLALQRVIFRPADNARIARAGAMGGWDTLRQRLIGDNDGRPMIYWFSTCTALIRTLPMLQHDPSKAEDLDTKAEDHAADTARYAVMSRPWVRPRPIPLSERLSVPMTHDAMKAWREDRDRRAKDRL
jgi:hypothetical protein